MFECCWINRVLLCFQKGAGFLSDEEVMLLVQSKNIPAYKLEALMQTPERGVAIRRHMLASSLPCPGALSALPYLNYDYSKVSSGDVLLRDNRLGQISLTSVLSRYLALLCCLNRICLVVH